MARIKGQIQFTGKLGELSAYMTQDGIVLRARSGPDKKRLKKDPAFSAVYNQSQEFGACAKAAKLLRNSVQLLIYQTCDNRLSSRLNKVMHEIKNLDVIAAPGKRRVNNGLKDPKAINLLNGINLNIQSKLRDFLLLPYRVDFLTQTIDFGVIDPKKAFKRPNGATEVCVHGAHAFIDFEKQVFETVEDKIVIPLKGGSTSLKLDLKNNSNLQGQHVYVLKISFLQEVNGLMYALEDGTLKACEVVGTLG